MSPTEDLSEYSLSVSHVAAMLNVQPMTVRRWIETDVFLHAGFLAPSPTRFAARTSTL